MRTTSMSDNRNDRQSKVILLICKQITLMDSYWRDFSSSPHTAGLQLIIFIIHSSANYFLLWSIKTVIVCNLWSCNQKLVLTWSFSRSKVSGIIGQKIPKSSPWRETLTNHRSFQRERAFLLAVLRLVGGAWYFLNWSQHGCRVTNVVILQLKIITFSNKKKYIHRAFRKVPNKT